MRALHVRASRGAGREAPMTWGQLTQQAIYDFTAEESYRQTQRRSLELPSGGAPQRLAAALRCVLERHESLRTRFTADRRQQVRPAVELSVPIIAVESESEEKQLGGKLYRQAFGPDDLPVRFQLLQRADGSANLLIMASHLAVDAFGADRLVDELSRLCDSIDPDSLPPPAGQPVDRVDFEQSAAGRTLSQRNIKRWLRLHEDGVASTPPPVRPGLRPRFHTGTLLSPRLRRALPIASARLGVPPAVLLLAAMSSTLGRRFDVSRMASRIAFGNRIDPQDFGIETLMQWGLAVVDVRGSASDVVRSAFRETMRASATARYDIYELFNTMSTDPTVPHQRFLPQAHLNYFNDAGPSLAPLDQDEASLPESTFTTTPNHENDSDSLFFLFALPNPETMLLFFMVDTRIMSPADLEESARALESWVLRSGEN